MTKIIELIYNYSERKGTGKSDEDPIRILTQLITKDGLLVVEYDPFTKITKYKPENLNIN